MQIQNIATISSYYTQCPTPFFKDLTISQGIDKFIIYGSGLTLNKLQAFQHKTNENFIILDYWNELYNTVVLLQGDWNVKYLEYAHQLALDVALINFDTCLSQSGLLVMDMDSTIIQMECIDEVAKLAGTGEMVSAITAQAMRGELDFQQSLRRRVATLKDAPESILQQVREKLPLMSGVKEMINGLQQYGWKTAIASGGFTYFADYLKDLLGLDYAISNEFEIIDGKLTGKVKGDIVDADYKAKTLEKLAKEFNIDIKDTVAIGDGANDLAMMAVANLGGAFHAKPKVQQQAQVVVNFADLTALLCILSANDRIKKLLGVNNAFI
ncbi:phosphoserine phosphatase [Bisgaardia hudsonensis]|uniref:Phosphoserine phosphatase n=1 Tax=Bisgaardia hudsonensis TaxID=109472 RepID=A0A4R2MXF7_9PAST|nr:phosphoserine phosphatase [Bisgaardia hudsonensis]QLB12293.1 phosphoserine phosphatase SerB [Bisgaardia hudsonensis]TCP12337.1 phosphoserine phosphatase [Bisgaardia hudsonensis]